MRPNCLLAFAPCLMLLAFGCDKPGSPSPAPAASSGPLVAQGTTPAVASASSTAPPASASAAAPSLATLFEGRAAADTRRSETVFGAGGVYAGLPPEWSTSDVYNAYLIAETKEAKTMVYLVAEGGLESKELEQFASGAAYPIYLKDLAWDGDWLDAKVGPSEYRAKVRRGHGISIFSKTTPRAAICVAVEVPGRKTIHILGSWNAPSPMAERQFADLVKGIGRCKHKPARGCVPVAPSGEETELESPPKGAPGSSPFG